MTLAQKCALFKPGFASKLTKPKMFGLFVKNNRSLILHNRIQANYSFSIGPTCAEQSRCCGGLVCVREGPAQHVFYNQYHRIDRTKYAAPAV